MRFRPSSTQTPESADFKSGVESFVEKASVDGNGFASFSPKRGVLKSHQCCQVLKTPLKSQQTDTGKSDSDMYS